MFLSSKATLFARIRLQKQSKKTGTSDYFFFWTWCGQVLKRLCARVQYWLFIKLMYANQMIVLLCGAFGSGVSLGLQRTSWWDTGRHGWLSDACRSIAAYTHVYAGSERWTPTNTSKHVVYGQSIYMLKGYMCMDIQSSQERSNINLYCYLFCTYEYIYSNGSNDCAFSFP